MSQSRAASSSPRFEVLRSPTLREEVHRDDVEARTLREGQGQRPLTAPDVEDPGWSTPASVDDVRRKEPLPGQVLPSHVVGRADDVDQDPIDSLPGMPPGRHESRGRGARVI